MSTSTVPSLDGLYSDHVNPQWVKLLNVLQMNVTYERCASKVAPPLVVTEAQFQEFVTAVRDVVDVMHHSPSFWTEALGMARRVVNI
ncbi:MAG: hypothetical protein ABI759_26015 [Candidatus Solibacter sp.]